MKAQFKILSGSRAGQVHVISKAEITVGRHPSSDLRFHADQDLDVSSRHAVITKSGNGWIVRDLQSRNGTMVNGHSIHGDTRLDDTDQVRFGADGPNVEFRAVADSVADTPAPSFDPPTGGILRPSVGAQAAPPPTPAAGTRPRAAGAPAGGSTTQRIRVEVAKQTAKMRVVSVVLIVVLLGAVGGFYAWTQMQEAKREAEVAQMRTATDEALRQVQVQLAGLTDALRRSQTEVQQLQNELNSARASGDQSQVAQLSRRLDEANNALRNQQEAAQVDYRSINVANNHAIALVFVEFAPGESYTGTAFTVRKDGLLVTNRHVVAGEDGRRRPLRIAVRFSDSFQNFRGTLVKISEEADLAVIRVDSLGDVPVVKGINTSGDIQPGDPVGSIGFPLGVELPMGQTAGKQVAKTTFGVGTVSKVLPEMIQIDGYSAQGASGSPFFNRNGEVVAVLYGGQPGTSGRILYAVPASFVTKLLQSIN